MGTLACYIWTRPQQKQLQQLCDSYRSREIVILSGQDDELMLRWVVDRLLMESTNRIVWKMQCVEDVHGTLEAFDCICIRLAVPYQTKLHMAIHQLILVSVSYDTAKGNIFINGPVVSYSGADADT